MTIGRHGSGDRAWETSTIRSMYPPYLQDEQARDAAGRAVQERRNKPLAILVKSTLLATVVGPIVVVATDALSYWTAGVLVFLSSIITVALIEGVLERARLARVYRETLRRFPNICPKCGYCLGPPPRPERCPECGEPQKPLRATHDV